MPGSRFCVAALNVLQNSMMLSPRWPSAGPIGGEGFALPAGTCNLMIPTIFLAIYVSKSGRSAILNLLDLRILQLDGGGAPEDRDSDLEPRPLFIHVLNEPVERGERPVA